MEKLFHKLINKINVAEYRTLYNYYESQICYVELDGKLSKTFDTGSRVKQEGPLSPKLYNIYIKDLIDQIKNLKFGAVVLDFKKRHYNIRR
jgi:hypothetical protein